MRLFRALLAVLVGLNLTLICQGHDTAGRQTGPHVSLLAENNIGHSPAATGHSHAHNAGHTHHHSNQKLSELTFPSSSPRNLQQKVAPGAPALNAAQSLDSLSLQVVIIFAALSVILRRYHLAPGRQPLFGANSGSPPEHPPPRYFSLAPAV